MPVGDIGGVVKRGKLLPIAGEVIIGCLIGDCCVIAFIGTLLIG